MTMTTNAQAAMTDIEQTYYGNSNFGKITGHARRGDELSS